MDNNLENNDWKKEAPALAALPVRHPFSVPEKYFEQLTIEVGNHIYVEKMKASAGQAGYSAPSNYFEELNERISNQVFTEKLKAIASPTEFTVPLDYFKEAQANILSKTTGNKPAKVVKLWHSSILKYASAACFVILSASGLYFYEQQQQDTTLAFQEMATEQMLYDIEEQVIIEHIEANELKQTKQSATDVALENYILNNYSQSDIASNL